MPTVHPTHMRRALRRVKAKAERAAVLNAPGSTPQAETHRAMLRHEAVQLTPEEVDEGMALIRNMLRRLD
jgi:hypothetical protein